jgi:hypothetical protein
MTNPNFTRKELELMDDKLLNQLFGELEKKSDKILLNAWLPLLKKDKNWNGNPYHYMGAIPKLPTGYTNLSSTLWDIKCEISRRKWKAEKDEYFRKTGKKLSMNFPG